MSSAPGPRWGVVADIHSNLQALETVLDWLDGQGVDEIYCLGDVVGYGGDPAACVALVRARCTGTVRGNHDAALVDPAARVAFNPHARRAIEGQAGLLDDVDKAWLAGLPWTLVPHPDVTFAHSGFADPPAFDYLLSPADAAAEFAALATRVGFVAHTHIPMVFRQAPDRSLDERSMRSERTRVGLAGPARYIVNPGAVGQPRDGDPRAACAILDLGAGELRHARLEYDVETAQRAIARAGMPAFEAERLVAGR